ncbi:hypothetical protein [Chlamydiifrater volucris]|uniref:hypothetical protein n=1 Tax=Chlamydiifrater volucris TaxID=2681470 RepID=UPI001BCDB4F4|nr:hypothetical protein [Chlamydiifrater volucris]
MEEQPLEENLPGEEESSKTKISFPTFNRYTITTLVGEKENQPVEPEQKLKQTDELTINEQENEATKSQALTVEESLSTDSLILTKDLTKAKNLTTAREVFVKDAIKLSPSGTINIDGKLNLLNSTILYKNITKAFDTTRISDRRDQEYVPYGELKKYGVSFYTRSAWSNGPVGEKGSVYKGQYFSWNNYETNHEEKYNVDGVIQLEDGKGTTSENKLRNYYLAFKKPGIYRISVAISKHGAWLDNGRGGLNELKVTFDNGYTHKIGHMTTAGQTNYNYRSSGIVGAVISADQPGKFWIECIGSAYRMHMFDWSLIRLPSLQWDP